MYSAIEMIKNDILTDFLRLFDEGATGSDDAKKSEAVVGFKSSETFFFKSNKRGKL